MTVILTQHYKSAYLTDYDVDFHYPLLPPLCATITRDSMAQNEAFFVSSVTVFVANISLHYVSCYEVATLCSCIRRNFTLCQNVVSREFSVFLCTVYSCVILSSIPVHLLSAILLVEETLHMFLELPLLSFLISTIISVLQHAQVPTRWFS